MTKTIILDEWFWGEIHIKQEHCDKCKYSDTITIRKKDINKLIKILKRLNYKGLPKNIGLSKEYILNEEKNR